MIRRIQALHLGCTLRIEALLVEGLLRLTDVVQEVDVGLLHALRGLADTELIDGLLTVLLTELSKARRHLLANAKLLSCKCTDALANVLKLPRLLAVDAGERLCGTRASRALLHEEVRNVLLHPRLLARDRRLLRGKIAVALGRLLVKTGRGLPQTGLFDAQLPKALSCRNLLLREVAIKAGCGLTKPRLLRRLLSRGRADVGKLSCGRLFGSRALRFE